MALSVKYSSSIKKCLAVSGSIVLTTAFGHIVQDGPMNTWIVLGSALVILSVWKYNIQPKSEDVAVVCSEERAEKEVLYTKEKSISDSV